MEPKNLQDCDPIRVVADLSEHQKYSVNGDRMNDDWPAIPCGLIAKSVFNDEFVLWNVDEDKEQKIDSSDIAWESDVNYLFKNIKDSEIPSDLANVKDWKDIQWFDMEDQHYIVWMRTAGLPDFRKLWGKIDEDTLKSGKYELRIKNHFDASPFDGTKSFVLATATAMGGKNFLLGYSFIFVGILSIVYAIVFLIVLRKKM